MGNKQRANKDRKRVDTRTKKRRRSTSNSKCSSGSLLATTAAAATTTTNADRMENTPTSLSCGASSSMSTCSSPAFEASSSPGPSSDREDITTASERKIKESEGYLPSTSIDELDVDEGYQPAYVFMDTGILSNLLDELVKCPRCGFPVKTTHLIGNKKGLSHSFNIACMSVSCRWDKSFFSSKEVEGWLWKQSL